MEQSSEKNFNILASLLLQGIGSCLILIPGHVGVDVSGGKMLLHNLAGLFCFINALAIQVITIMTVRRWKARVIQISGGILLVITGGMLFSNEQNIGAFSMVISGIMLLALLSPWLERFKREVSFNWAIVVLSFFAGLGLLFAPQNDLSAASITLVILFFVTAFIAAAAIIIPGIKYSRLAQKAQIIPWVGAGIFFAVTNMDNLIIPTAVITMLLVERYIPWDQLEMSKEDILSRRVIMIAAFTELANIIFLGALLHIVEGRVEDYSFPSFTPREASFMFFFLFSAMTYYASITVVMTTNGLIHELNKTVEPDHWDEEEKAITWDSKHWGRRLERYIRPFLMSAEGIRRRVQTDQINTLSRQVMTEKNRNTQLLLLLELGQQLENQLDQPVSAQIAANMLERAISCEMVYIFLHSPEEKKFSLLASAGKNSNIIPAIYQQDTKSGVMGRALRQRKTQIVSDTRTDPDFLPVSTKEKNLSIVVAPLNFNGHIHGMIVLGSENPNAFGSLEVGLVESVAAELIRAWERSGYHQRLKNLIQTGSQLSSTPNPESTAHDVAAISRGTMQAKFAFIYIKLGQDQSYILYASSGKAPVLKKSLATDSTSLGLFNLALHASQPFRIRDIRKYEWTAHLLLDNPGLRSMLAIPIRWHNVSIGAIFVFGKQNEVLFTENDESLAELISIQAGGAFESIWLQQELRTSLRITSLLYRLSNQIIQSENIEEAAFDIAQTAHKLGRNTKTGIVLFDHNQKIIAEIQVDDAGRNAEVDKPQKLIQDTVEARRMLQVVQDNNALRTCMPIQTPIRSYGALWMDSLDDPSKPAANPNDLQALVTQSAIALERSLLLVESRRQAKEIQEAYHTLEKTYDQTLASLTSALDARDRETEGHSMRVTKLAVKLGEALGYSKEQLKILERGSILHDIGKIGISDNILHKPGPLNEDEWRMMRLHPGIGARIVSGIPFLEDTIQLIECHQERWDGSGYPLGLKGKEIPELARLFAIIDAFDALTSNRPYRQKISYKEALEYLKEMSGIHFDPDMVTAFENLLQKEPQLLELLDT